MEYKKRGRILFDLFQTEVRSHLTDEFSNLNQSKLWRKPFIKHVWLLIYKSISGHVMVLECESKRYILHIKSMRGISI